MKQWLNINCWGVKLILRIYTCKLTKCITENDKSS